MKHNQTQIYTDIFKFLKENRIMTLATADKNPWVCTVYYGMDDKMNLYIVTDPTAKHALHIAKNANVAFAVFDSHTKVTDSKRGIQAAGICRMVTGVAAVTKGFSLWCVANPGMEARIPLKDLLKKVTDSRIYKVTPTYVKFFNKELYGKDAYGIIDL